MSDWEEYQHFRTRGLDAHRAGNDSAAKMYLLQAARSMSALARRAGNEPLRQARAEHARRLLQRASELDQKALAAAGEPAPPRQPGQSAWQVKEKSSIRFDDVAGMESVKDWIRLKMLYPFQFPDLAKQFAIRPGGGVLLYGPPGTGKTLLARAVAGEIDAPFFAVSAAQILSKWVGEAEQNVRQLFQQAKSRPRAVMFFDEAEALGGRRGEESSGVMQRVVGQILQEMEGFHSDGARNVLVMAATNVPWQMDEALLRPGRFDQAVYIPLPDEPARQLLLEIHLRSRPLATDFDAARWAKELDGYSGADIRELCDRAAAIPFLRAVGGQEIHPIDNAAFAQARAGLQPSVSQQTLRRFENWKIS